jgi:hypothetical protein
MQTERKIEQAKLAADMVLHKQRKDFEERQQKVEEKRRQFDESRSRERQDIQKKSLLEAIGHSEGD